MTAYRLPEGGLVDRTVSLDFRFDGQGFKRKDGSAF